MLIKVCLKVTLLCVSAQTFPVSRGKQMCVQFEDQDLLSSFLPSTLSPSGRPGLGQPQGRVSGGLWPCLRSPDPPWALTEPTSGHAAPPSLLPAGRRDGQHHYWVQEGGGAADHRLGSCGGAIESLPPPPPGSAVTESPTTAGTDLQHTHSIQGEGQDASLRSGRTGVAGPW